MPRKTHMPEEIVAKLRQVDVLMSQGAPLGEPTSKLKAPRAAGISRWSDVPAAPGELLERANYRRFEKML